MWTYVMFEMLAFIYIFAGVLCAFGSAEVIRLSQGTVNGTVLYSRHNNPFFAFYGIPYAKPPVGDLRFKPPEEATSWEGVRDAASKPPSCWQPKFFAKNDTEFLGQEDCLYINVFTPELRPKKPLPVLVYIHGGAFHIGSGDAKGPHFFMDESVVFVSFNHRHGVFGYLSSGDRLVPGNYGLKDQVEALKWVQKNIGSFGGDPNMVTLLGQSSGAACVHFHTMSPLSKGLFHRVIMQSGSALTLWSHYNYKNTRRSFFDLVTKVGCFKKDKNRTLTCLKELPAEKLIRAEHSFLTEKHIIIKFRPTVEMEVVKNHAIESPPSNFTYQNTSIPWLIGFNSAEGFIDTAWIMKTLVKSQLNLKKMLNKILPTILHYKYIIKRNLVHNVTNLLKQHYFQNKYIKKGTDQRVCDLVGDIVFSMPIMEAALSYPGKKYFYYNDYRNSINMARIFFNYTKELGTSHGDDLLTLMYTPLYEKLNTNDKRMSEKMVAYWSNFVIKGDPNNDELPHWDPMQTDAVEYINFENSGISMKKNLLTDSYAFWKSLPIHGAH